MTTAREQFEKLYGHLGLATSDAAWFVFLSGWNCALEQTAKEFERLPFGDTATSTATYIRNNKE
jgi:hypothetical protein